jgi:glycosyltransferase involved in cell wall biosynthesis
MGLVKENLKIAMLGHKRIPSREGGVEIVVEELATRMAAQGNSVTCYNRNGHHVSGKNFDSEKVSEYRDVHLKSVFTIDKKGLAAVTSSFSASVRAALGKYDVVHIHAEGPAFMCWLPKLFGKKVIVTVHGLDHQRAKWGRFASWYILSGEKNAVKFADGIIVLSESVRKYFKDTYNRETVFIPNGVNRPEIVAAQEITERWGLEKDSYILFLGRLVPEKGIHYLIEAFKSVKTDKKLVIAGGSSDTTEYMDSLKKIAGDNVIFTGFQQGQILEELYSNAYIYCLPSDLEGMPLSLLEAMSYGNCCLTSDIPECAEVVEEKAVTFKKTDVMDLRERLQKLCSDPESVQKYKDGAADFICKKYSWDDVVERTLALYREQE